MVKPGMKRKLSKCNHWWRNNHLNKHESQLLSWGYTVSKLCTWIWIYSFYHTLISVAVTEHSFASTSSPVKRKQKDIKVLRSTVNCNRIRPLKSRLWQLFVGTVTTCAPSSRKRRIPRARREQRTNKRDLNKVIHQSLFLKQALHTYSLPLSQGALIKFSVLSESKNE